MLARSTRDEKAAAERARKGDGPTFVEAVTYRRLGRGGGDDPTHRDEAEVKASGEGPDDTLAAAAPDGALALEREEGNGVEGRHRAAHDDAIAAAEKPPPADEDALVTDILPRT